MTNSSWGTPSTQAAPTNSTKRIGAIIAALVGVIALTAGITWAIAANINSDSPSDSAAASLTTESSPEGAASENSTAAEETTESTKKKYTIVDDAEYTKEEKCGEKADVSRDQINYAITVFCNDDWLLLTAKNSSQYYLYTWTGSRWARPVADGEHAHTYEECYDRDKLLEGGFPGEYLDDVSLCSQQELASEQKEELKPGYLGDLCDGSYILIVDSVLVPYGELRTPHVDQALAQHPGAKSMPGLACNSLRSEVDGKEVFAIYYDAGHSVDKVCELKAQYGGNARSLNNNADFTDPC